MPGETDVDVELDTRLLTRLHEAYQEHSHPGLRRVIRDAAGREALPTGLDYLAAVTHTDGDVALELGVNHPGRAAIRGHDAVPDAVGETYQLAGERDEPRVTSVDRNGVQALLASYAVEPVLHRDVAQLFADATEIETADPLTRL